jgi:hypothetical protein
MLTMEVYEIPPGDAVACGGPQVGQAQAPGWRATAGASWHRDWIADSEGELTLAKMARAMVEAWQASPQGGVATSN